MLTVKFRYKKPNDRKSIAIEKILKKDDVFYDKQDFYFSSAVALFAQKLKGSKYVNAVTYDYIVQLAEKGRGKDVDGYRAEFIRLVKTFN